jgi:hypothetical protein
MTFSPGTCKILSFGGVWTGKVDAGGEPVGFGNIDFTDSPKADLIQITGHFGYGIGSGRGWCVCRFKAGDVFEGFMDSAVIDGHGCLHKKYRETGQDELGFYKGEWRAGTLVDGILYASDGSAPLQYQCKTERRESVRSIARILSERMFSTVSVADLAEELVRLNSTEIPALATSSWIHSHTILLLPESLRALVSQPAAVRRGRTPVQDIYAAGPASGRRFDFLIGEIVEVRSYASWRTVRVEPCRDQP